MKRMVAIVAVLMTLLLPVAKSAETKGNPLDAPEAAFWHAQSRTWFVSNMSGGLSLVRDSFVWLTNFCRSELCSSQTLISEKKPKLAWLTFGLGFSPGIFDTPGSYAIDISFVFSFSHSCLLSQQANTIPYPVYTPSCIPITRKIRAFIDIYWARP